MGSVQMAARILRRMERRGLGPVRLIWIALGSGVLAAGGWLVSFLPIQLFAYFTSDPGNLHLAERLRLAVLILPVSVGFIASFRAESRFNDGFRADLWSEAELVEVRRIVGRRIWFWLGVICVVLCLMSVIIGKHNAAGGFLYVAMMPMVSAQRLRQLLEPPRQPSLGLTGWRNLKRIWSEHWGERGV